MNVNQTIITALNEILTFHTKEDGPFSSYGIRLHITGGPHPGSIHLTPYLLRHLAMMATVLADEIEAGDEE